MLELIGFLTVCYLAYRVFDAEYSKPDNDDE